MTRGQLPVCGHRVNWRSGREQAPASELFRHTVDVIVAAHRVIEDRLRLGEFLRCFDRRYADMKRREAGHHDLVARHTDDATRVGRTEFVAGIVHRVRDGTEEVAFAYRATEADIGQHSIEYALHTHPSDWRDSNVPRRGYEFNYPPHIIRPGKHRGDLPAEHSFFSAEPGNVAMTAAKKAEDGDGIIIRLVETDGRPGIAKVHLPWEPKSVVETNLIEDDSGKPSTSVDFSGNKLSIPVGKFEIKTLKLIF